MKQTRKHAQNNTKWLCNEHYLPVFQFKQNLVNETVMQHLYDG